MYNEKDRKRQGLRCSQFRTGRRDVSVRYTQGGDGSRRMDAEAKGREIMVPLYYLSAQWHIDGVNGLGVASET